MTSRVKTLMLVVALAACSKKPARPDDKAFAAMTSAQKCEATLPRAKSCTDELMVAEIRSLGPDTAELGAELEKDVGDTPTYKDEAEAIHQQACLGALDDGYTKAIVQCWDADGCKAFADCVVKAERAAAARPSAVAPSAGPAALDDDGAPASGSSGAGAGSGGGSGSARPKIQLEE